MIASLPARVRRPARPRIAVAGHPIRARAVQQLGWGSASALFCAGIIAGLYFLLLEVNWYIHIGPLYVHLFYLKHWWDAGMARWIVPGFFSTAAWPLYRHGWRNLVEPAMATVGAKSLMARRWQGDDVRLGADALAGTLVLLLVVTTALAVGGIWLLDFGFPAAWHGALGSYTLPLGPVANWSLGTLALGIVIGQVVHRIWAPAGNTIQGFFTDRSVDRIRRIRDSRPGYLPVWVRRPLAPPIVRERASWVLDTGRDTRSHGTLDRGVILTVMAAGLLIGITGLIAHYWIGTGHAFPYLAP